MSNRAEIEAIMELLDKGRVDLAREWLEQVATYLPDPDEGEAICAAFLRDQYIRRGTAKPVPGTGMED